MVLLDPGLVWGISMLPQQCLSSMVGLAHRLNLPGQVQIKELGPVTKPGSGRRTGEAAGSFVAWESQTAAAIKAAREAELRADDEPADTATSSGGGAPATGAMASAEGSMDGAGLPQVDPGSVNRRVKRKKLALVLNSA